MISATRDQRTCSSGKTEFFDIADSDNEQLDNEQFDNEQFDKDPVLNGRTWNNSRAQFMTPLHKFQPHVEPSELASSSKRVWLNPKVQQVPKSQNPSTTRVWTRSKVNNNGGNEDEEQPCGSAQRTGDTRLRRHQDRESNTRGVELATRPAES